MIGFFDSGVGGLTVEQEVKKRLPQYSRVYLGDGARGPYGNKSHEELVEFAWQGVEWLFDQGAELVIVACNSVSASALRELQQQRLNQYSGKRILGVIVPTVEELARRGYDDVAILSTVATKESQAYPNEFKKLDKGIDVTSHACPTWAPLIEAGEAASEKMKQEVVREMDALKNTDPDVEAVLLACTHYPYVKELIRAELGKEVEVFEQGEIVAASLEDYLKRHPEIEQKLDRTQKIGYYTTGDKDMSTKVAQEAFGFNVSFEHIDLEEELKKASE